MTEDAEKKRTDGKKRGEKRNNKLAGRVIQYSQFGSLVLQSVKVAAAGKYACRATNGIDDETAGNKTMSNTVRLYVKRKYRVGLFDYYLIFYSFLHDRLFSRTETDKPTAPVIKVVSCSGIFTGSIIGIEPHSSEWLSE